MLHQICKQPKTEVWHSLAGRILLNYASRALRFVLPVLLLCSPCLL
jgi:hypothetical protein